MQTMAGGEHGGAEAFFVRLAGGFARAGVEQRVVVRRNAARAAALRARGVEPVELRFGGPLDWPTRRALRREAAAFRPDVALAWMSRAARLTPAGDHVLVGRLGGYYDLKYHRRCDHLIGNTRDIVDYLTEAGWPAERAHYLPNFVDPPAGAADRAALAAALDTPADAPLLVALGRLHPNKAFDVLLTALAEVPEAHLWLAGAGLEEGALRALADELDVAPRVRSLGWRDDAAALIAAADVLVVPSRHEPLGNVVLEGWAAGTPVVAADTAGPATLIEDGRTGRLVPVDDAPALAAALNDVLADPAAARSLAAAGHAAWQADYTEAAVVAAYLDFFARIVPQGRA